MEILLHNRIVDHVYEAFKRQRKDKFHVALKEFGMKNFEFIEIFKSNNKTNLAKRERFFIKEYDSITNGYNTQIRNDRG